MEKPVPLVMTSRSRSKKDTGTRPSKNRPLEQKIIQRSRLINLLSSNQDKKLVLILGQAAQGKTTLASSYLTQASRPYIWINLAADDSDPVTLFFKMAQALQSPFKEKDLSPLLDLPSLTMSPRPENLLYRDWTQAFYKTIPAPFLIVLDSLDRLSAQAPSWIFLQILIQEIPKGIQIFLLSRERPPLNIERWQMSQEAFTLTNEDLAFSLDEVTAFFKSGKGVPFSSDQVKKIHHYTQGWAGGLRILFELARVHPGNLTTHEGFNHILEGLTHQAFDYFSEELFSSLTLEMQDVLIRSSVFDVIESKIIKEIFPEQNAEEILDSLVRRNLFVSSGFNRETGRHYRYHQMFQEFLLDKFKSRLTWMEQQYFLNQTAEALEKAGAPEKSLTFFLQAQNYPMAVTLVKKIGLDLFKQGKIGVLAGYLENLPKDFIQNDPWLLFFFCLAHRWTDPLENILRLRNCLDIFESQNDQQGILLALAYLIEALMFQGGSWKEIKRYLEKGEKYLALLNSEEMTYEMATLWLQISFIQTIRGNLRKGHQASQLAYLLGKKIGDFIIQGGALYHSIEAMLMVGEYDLAHNQAKKLKALLENVPSPDLSFLYHNTLGLLYSFQGEAEKGLSFILRAKEEVDLYGLFYWYPVSLFYQLIHAVFSDQHSEAEQIGNNLQGLAEAMAISFIKGLVALFQGINFFKQDRLAQAEEGLSQAVKLLSADESRTEYHLHYAMALLSLVHIRRLASPDEDKELKEAIGYFEDIRAHLFLAESYLIAALQASFKNRKEQVLKYLTAGVRIILDKGYGHFLLLRGRDIGQVSALILEYELPGAQDLIGGLLAGRYGPFIKLEMEKLFGHPRLAIREKAREIHKAIHRSQIPGLHLKTLGPFQVLRGEIPIRDEEWEGNVARKLLKAILSFGSPRVPKDWLLEMLWPEASPMTAERNFKIALHRLRKSLEPEMDEAIGSSYVHHKNNLVFLDEGLCRVDADHFHSLVQKGRDEERKGGFKKALALYQEAECLYQGDFLAEDIYETWVLPRQEEMKRSYLEVLFNQARLNQTRGSFRPAETCLRKIIQIDPLNEEAYQKLMLLYGNNGRRNEVLKVYEKCRLALESTLGVPPDKSTTAIYKKFTALS